MIRRLQGLTVEEAASFWDALIGQEKVVVIPKAASENHLRSNFDIFDFELSDEEMERIFALRR
jgi:2,5-diketo-D-gluconate reductase B